MTLHPCTNILMCRMTFSFFIQRLTLDLFERGNNSYPFSFFLTRYLIHLSPRHTRWTVFLFLTFHASNQQPKQAQTCMVTIAQLFYYYLCAFILFILFLLLPCLYFLFLWVVLLSYLVFYLLLFISTLYFVSYVTFSFLSCFF